MKIEYTIYADELIDFIKKHSSTHYPISHVFFNVSENGCLDSVKLVCEEVSDI
jgi:hypothetical protein